MPVRRARHRGADRAAHELELAGGERLGYSTTAAARHYGSPVTIVEPGPAPLHATFGRELGGYFADLHRRHGVELRFGTGVTGFAGECAVSAVLTGGGAGDARPRGGPRRPAVFFLRPGRRRDGVHRLVPARRLRPRRHPRRRRGVPQWTDRRPGPAGRPGSD
ncbi:FAD-dependent oxidoreductase [Amycolatopsis sp. NPDC003861]